MDTGMVPGPEFLNYLPSCINFWSTLLDSCWNCFPQEPRTITATNNYHHNNTSNPKPEQIEDKKKNIRTTYATKNPIK